MASNPEYIILDILIYALLLTSASIAIMQIASGEVFVGDTIFVFLLLIAAFVVYRYKER